MPGVDTKCENPACLSPYQVVATYRHDHGPLAKTWTAPAVGPTPTSTPFPQPCPNDGVSCQPVSAKCSTCGWTKQYQV